MVGLTTQNTSATMEHLKKNIFDPQLVAATDAESVDTKGRVCIQNPCNLCFYPILMLILIIHYFVYMTLLGCADRRLVTAVCFLQPNCRQQNMKNVGNIKYFEIIFFFLCSPHETKKEVLK